MKLAVNNFCYVSRDGEKLSHLWIYKRTRRHGESRHKVASDT